ncbi:hypothetical protein E2493_02620 [Sphingomonas parva]|uniref:DUF6946 domain-containing protein n=1 Tax=Sphingomonas parva TaxID=2555898 RepID=A0A4Y8ZUQ9_9SPHN|nr:hypothetical protein [Sphingomonas parva]TFI59751.1 hypothetical protein E2493_02620 [Sphingomonas parva]
MKRSIRRIHVPLLAPEAIKPHLVSPKQYAPGRSTALVTQSWFSANGLPPRLRAILEQAPEWSGVQMLDAWLERQVDLEDGMASPSRCDALAICSLREELGVLTVEAKLHESFDWTINARLARGLSVGETTRTRRLLERLRLPPEGSGHLRYQLLHRVLCAVLEAKRYRARHAAMLVQSFSAKASRFSEFHDLAVAMGYGTVNQDRISGPIVIEGVGLRIGWVSDPA